MQSDGSKATMEHPGVKAPVKIVGDRIYVKHRTLTAQMPSSKMSESRQDTGHQTSYQRMEENQNRDIRSKDSRSESSLVRKESYDQGNFVNHAQNCYNRQKDRYDAAPYDYHNSTPPDFQMSRNYGSPQSRYDALGYCSVTDYPPRPKGVVVHDRPEKEEEQNYYHKDRETGESHRKTYVHEGSRNLDYHSFARSNQTHNYETHGAVRSQAGMDRESAHYNNSQKHRDHQFSHHEAPKSQYNTQGDYTYARTPSTPNSQDYYKGPYSGRSSPEVINIYSDEPTPPRPTIAHSSNEGIESISILLAPYKGSKMTKDGKAQSKKSAKGNEDGTTSSEPAEIQKHTEKKPVAKSSSGSAKPVLSHGESSDGTDKSKSPAHMGTYAQLFLEEYNGIRNENERQKVKIQGLIRQIEFSTKNWNDEKKKVQQLEHDLTVAKRCLEVSKSSEKKRMTEAELKIRDKDRTIADILGEIEKLKLENKRLVCEIKQMPLNESYDESDDSEFESYVPPRHVSMEKEADAFSN